MNSLISSALLCPGSYIKIPQPWQLIKNRNLFLMVLGAANPRSGVSVVGTWEGPLPACGGGWG